LPDIRAPAFANAHTVTRVDRELVITIPLPEDVARWVAGRPRGTRYPPDHRARAPGPRLRDFRARHGLTQDEVAAVLGADRSAVAQWERSATIPEGVLREELGLLLDRRRWPELRTAMLGADGDGLPVAWSRAVRWYRRASRERRARDTFGLAVAALLEELRGVATVEALREHYRAQDDDRARAEAERCGLEGEDGMAVRRIADCAHGLRWLELADGLVVNLGRSLIHQLSLALLDGNSAPQ
jgi:transcriptional regulator with XRE-family HTH domain